MRTLLHLLVLMLKPPRKARLLADLERLRDECCGLEGQLEHNDYVWDQRTTQLERELEDLHRRISTGMISLRTAQKALHVETYIPTVKNRECFLLDRIEEAQSALRHVEGALDP